MNSNQLYAAFLEAGERSSIVLFHRDRLSPEHGVAPLYNAQRDAIVLYQAIIVATKLRPLTADEMAGLEPLVRGYAKALSREGRPARVAPDEAVLALCACMERVPAELAKVLADLEEPLDTLPAIAEDSVDDASEASEDDESWAEAA